jgi:hypothetical protein
MVLTKAFAHDVKQRESEKIPVRRRRSNLRQKIGKKYGKHMGDEKRLSEEAASSCRWENN